jgi:PKD repeat protein
MSGVPAYVNNGVNRSGSNGIADYLAGGAVNSLKEYSIWNPTQYYNVWIVDEIDNENCSSNDGSYTTGYAYYSSSHGQLYDGSVVLICSYLSESDRTWAHEMGHAFNLPHTFNGDDSNNDGIGDQCGDDGIADTPKHIRTLSISPSIYSSCSSAVANSCDPLFNMEINPETGFRRNTGTVQDHMHNYMDYTGCSTEFTGGQRTVVSAALTANRASFLTSPALTPVSPATVYFTSSATNTCLGGTLNFYDESSCTPNTYTNAVFNKVSFLWTFDNKVDPPMTSTLQNPVITFTNLGVYDVTLAVTNPQGTTSLSKQDHIAVTSGVVAACSISSSSKNGNFGIGATKVSFN